MTSIREVVRRMFAPVRPLQAGMYHYQSPVDDPRNYRLHLRLEPDGTGLLIVNAATILHLNQTAAEYAYHLVNNSSDETAARIVSNRYKVSAQKALYDYRNLKERINLLLATADLDPEIFLDFGRVESQLASAPLRLDCALTYNLPEGVDTQFSPGKRVSRELSFDEWQTVIQKAWEAGIPHLVFTGGEPTLRPDLIPLLRQAEVNGQVTGLLSDGLKLENSTFFNELLQSGLDHMLFLLQPERESSWSILKTILAADLFTVVHHTLTPENHEDAVHVLEKLKALGVTHVSLSANNLLLKNTLAATGNRAAELNLKLVWDIPVPYSAFNPAVLETDAVENPKITGGNWLYVEPDGDVLVHQGSTQVIGNVLTDTWETIWAARLELAETKLT